jgi:hypothetical protein
MEKGRSSMGRNWQMIRVCTASFARSICVAVLLSLASPSVGWSGETNFPAPSYTKDELAKVKEWEEQWAGKKVDGSNVDQVADYLPAMYIDPIKNPEKWGGKPMWFTIVPHRHVVPTRGFTEATRKNAGTIKMDDQMVPVGYGEISGFPFPNPKTGWEVAWNYDFNNRGDSLYYRQDGVQVDRATGSDEASVYKTRNFWFASRTEGPPKPKIPDRDNPRGLRYVYMWDFEHPLVMAGSRIMIHRFLDLDKDDESYTWMAEYRRVRRVVASQKYDTQWGMERAVEDEDGFNNHIIVNNYKLLGRKELLTARHSDSTQWVRVPGQYLWSGIERERVNTYVVEVVSKDSNHIYSKRIWYVDPEDFFIKWTECYDRDGRLWRLLENQYGVFKNLSGEGVSFLTGIADLDGKKRAAAVIVNKPLTISGSFDLKLFNPQGMARGAY